MAQQIINVGASANDGTGDTLRLSQQKTNANTTELYNSKLDSVVAGTNVTVDNTDPLNPIVNASGGGNQLIEVTYSDLLNLKNTSTLIKGQTYLLTDYMTTYTQPVTLANKTSGIIEPLYITATDVDKLHIQCLSKLYPQDVVYYNIDDSTEGFTKGKIYRRFDTLKNNDIGTDWRHVKYDRSGVDKLLFESYSGFGITGNVIKTFDLMNTVIDNNNLFSNNVIDNEFLNNTISGVFVGNKIGGGFRDNTISGGFLGNNIGVGFGNNTISNSFYFNEVVYNFNQNIISGVFEYNRVDNGFVDNNISAYFDRNTVGANFVTNTIAGTFSSNLIDVYFENNNITSDFNFNKIDFNVRDNIFTGVTNSTFGGQVSNITSQVYIERCNINRRNMTLNVPAPGFYIIGLVTFDWSPLGTPITINDYTHISNGTGNYFPTRIYSNGVKIMSEYQDSFEDTIIEQIL